LQSKKDNKKDTAKLYCTDSFTVSDILTKSNLFC